jgi:hypothetical protein
MKMILSSLNLVRKIDVCITSEENLFNNLRCDQEWLSLLVTMKFGKFEIYQQRFIFVIA